MVSEVAIAIAAKATRHLSTFTCDIRRGVDALVGHKLDVRKEL
jgi:hypothetical protein